jgi:hypothetical protein
MGRVSWIFLGFILAACGTAGASFPFRYYNLKPDSYEGKLEGATPQDHLPLAVCAPSPGKQNKCTVLLSDAFTKLKSDFQKLQIENKQLRDDLASCK